MWTLYIILLTSSQPAVTQRDYATQERCQEALQKAIKGHKRYAAICAEPAPETPVEPLDSESEYY
jgi:hypothetical protein